MGYKVITSSGSGSWTVPSYVHKVKIMMLGAGGGGGGAAALTDNTSFNSGGGGGGGASVYFEWDVTPGSSISYVIGSGGTGGSGLVGGSPGPVSGSNGKDGGATSCTYKGTTYSAEGGRGGGGATALSGSGESGGAGGAGGSEGTYSKYSWKSGGYSGGGAGSSGSGYGAGSVGNGSCGGGGGGIYSSAYNMVKDVYHKSPLGGQGVRIDIEGDAHYQFMDGYLGTGGAGGPAGFKSGNITAIAGGDGGNGVIIIQYSELHAIKSGSGTWSTPSGVFRLLNVAIIGAGGGGGGSIKSRLSDNTREGGGGGGGGSVLYSVNTYPGKSWSYSVGSGGSGGRGISNLNTDYITGNPGGDGGETTFMGNIMSGGKGGGAGYKTQSGEGDGSGGAGGAANSSLGYPSPGGSGGAGWSSGSGYGAGSSVQNAGGGGGGIGNAAAHNFASGEGYTPNTPSSTSMDASEGGKNGQYGTGGGGDSGFDSSGEYGVGGRGGDGLILIEYPLAVDTVSFTIESTNGIANDPRNNGSESTYLTVTVPIGATYAVVDEYDTPQGGRDGYVKVTYDEQTIYMIPVSSNIGYGNPDWTSKSGTISSSTTVSVTYSKVTYSGTVHLGIKYAKFRIIYPSSYAGEYTSDKVIEYQYQDRVDVDWTGGTTIETVSPYVQRVYTHPDTNVEEAFYSPLYSQTEGDGKYMDAFSCDIYPYPGESPKPTSYTEYYRVRINFDANGGTLAAGTSEFISEWNTSQDIYVDLPPHPTRTNYAFKGWSINNNNPDPEDDPDVYPSESGHYFHFGDVILYAMWGVAITVYFDPYNDSNSDTVYSIKTDPVTDRLISTPPTPTPLDLNWAFSGWKCTQVSYFNTPRSSSEVAAYSFRGVGTELWFFGTYTQRKYYPVVFVDNLYSPTIAKCMKNEKPVLNWSDTIKTDDGENFNPSAKSWQPYQSSQIFETGYSGQVKLNKIINVFYRSGAPIYSDDNIHMAISCGKYGIIDLGDIQDISDSYSAMLTTIPIAPFGYSGTFCMDRGVQRSLSVGIVRVSPASPDDSSTDSKRWSNSKWISMLRAMTDRWQMMTDGVRLFMYVPKEKAHNVVALDSKYSLDTDGSINGGTTSVNAYIAQLPLSYSSDSVHKISLSMTFRVGTIYPKPPVIEMTAVTLKVGSKTKVIQYPSNSYSALPRCPAGMLDESVQIFYAWKVSTTPTIQMYPGDAFFVGLDAMTLTALYTDLKSKDCDLYTSESAMTYTVDAKSGKTHVTICAVGGGGAGAVGTILKTISVHVHGAYINPLNAGGGGGGSGYLSSRKIPISKGDKLYIKLGKGGQTKSASGEKTSVYLGETNGKLIVYADGGAGGKSGKTGGSGGAGFKSGGAGGYPFVSKGSDYPDKVKIIASMDGDGAPEAYGLGGVSSTYDVASVHYIRGGAGGGGAPPRVGTAEGMGGSGLELRDSSRSVDGTLGGGGGGTWGTGDGFGKGGDGYVCLFWE